jgi:hypothetical protein
VLKTDVLKTLVLASCLLLPCAGLGAQQNATPKPGSPERRQIADALRSEVEKELKKPVVFRIDALNLQNEWAFLRGVPLEIEAGTFDHWVCALLIKERGQWRVVTHAIAATDVPFVDWAERYHAPQSLFK